MTVSKEVVKFSELVTVDTSERGLLPQVVQNALKTVSSGSSIPIVVFTDPALSKVYGTYGYKDMRSQDYGSLFRKLKRKVRHAKKDHTFNTKLDAKSNDDDSSEIADETTDVTGASDTEDSGNIADAPFMQWQSKQGHKITAKLVEVKPMGVYVIETKAFRKIEVKRNDLSRESLEQADALLKKSKEETATP